MDEERCEVDLGPHVKKGYLLYVKGDCSKVLEDIKNYLGEYGLRHFESKLVFEDNGELSSPSTLITTQNTGPISEEKQADT
jgi:hypothetical protein